MGSDRKKSFDLGEVLHDWRLWQRRHKTPAVALGPQPRIEHRHDAAIAPVTDQPAEPLLKRENRERHLVFVERHPPSRLDGFDARRGDGITRGGEWQLVDNDAAQCLAHDVDALPEARRREQDCVRGVAELPQQLAPWRRALHEDWVVRREFSYRLHLAERRIAVEEHERTSA